MRFAWLMLVACADPARPPATTRAPSTPSASPAIPHDDPRCAKLARSHRVVVPRSREVEIARDSRGSYRGETVDHRLSLEVFGAAWTLDARDRTYHAFGEHCARLVAVVDAGIELEIALQAAHEYDPERCHVGCCPPGGSTAPDGTEECCFCSDVPR